MNLINLKILVINKLEKKFNLQFNGQRSELGNKEEEERRK